MELIHGNDRGAICRRIAVRAEAIYRGAATTDEELHDPTDINDGEDAEIASARKLAAHWHNGEFLEAWHVHKFPEASE